MNEKLNFIWSRRSVRRFTGRDITDSECNDLLAAGMAAPSACGKDPWEFVVLRDAALRRAVAGCLSNGAFLADAPLGVIVCGDQKRAHAESLSYLLQDCSAAIENILLAANALGLGGCWLGIHPREERIAALREIFDFPAGVIPVGAIALGEPAVLPEPRNRFSPLRVHDDRSWQRKK